MGTSRLRASLRGRLVTPDDPGFDSRVHALAWNALSLPNTNLPDLPRPAAIAQVADAADVQACVHFAREHGLQVAVRSGGHHWSGVAVGDGALQLDLAALDGITIDAAARVAHVQPAVTNRALAQALGAQGFAVPYGHCPGVALGGYLLGGGLGWNPREWGVACASVVAADVVTATGDLLQVSEEAHAELFAAVRGAGPLFPGVVTRFTLALQPLPRGIHKRVLVYPAARAAEAGAWLDGVAPALLPGVETLCQVSARGGDADCTVLATAFADDATQARTALEPFVGTACLAGSSTASGPFPASFDELFDAVGALYPAGHRCLADSFWFDVPAATLLPTLAAMLAGAPSTLSHALLVPAQPAEQSGLFSAPGGTYVVCYALWRDAGQDDVNQRWFDDVTACLSVRAKGHYVGEAALLGSHGQERLRGCFSEADWARLAAVRRSLDPHGLFAGASLA